jgi:hypothetical protein
MARVETNVFAVENLADFSSEYRLYRIRGLDRDQAEYHQNQEAIKRRLSYLLRNPVTIVDLESAPHLVVRSDSGEPPSPFSLVRARVRFEPVAGVMSLDYTRRSPDNDEICLRFINFMLTAALQSRTGLWSPGAGQPYFSRTPARELNRVGQYLGFSTRAIVIADGRIGLCVDVTYKYVSLQPLPATLQRDRFGQYKGQRCIYRFGHSWFEIRITGLADLLTGEYEIPENGGFVPLTEFIVGKSRKPIPPELAALSTEDSVIYYMNNQNEQRAAPTPLCFLTYGTEQGPAARLHRQTILDPHERRRITHEFVQNHLAKLRFGDRAIRLSTEPIYAPTRLFTVPDLAFGRDVTLSVRGTRDARHTTLDQLGRVRLSLLQDPEAGFYERRPLDRQYVVLPATVVDTFGDAFVRELRETVSAFFRPDEGSYDPIVVTYNDRVPHRYVHQGRAILAAVREHCTQAGCALVMIHNNDDRRLRSEDELGAMVVRRLQELHLRAAVIHATKSTECYEALQGPGGLRYRVRADKRRIFSGYMRNLAVSKVLLTNQRWPYVLATPLHADTVVGIDIKNNMVGLVVVGDSGRRVWWDVKTSRQPEHLLRDEAAAHLVALLRQEASFRKQGLARNIALHRDGRILSPEIAGYVDALEQLRTERVVDPTATVTILEISKSSPVPLRLFEVNQRQGTTPWVENPELGRFYIVGQDAFLCSTGRSSLQQGTARPLHVRHINGPMTLALALEDVYALTVLGSWTSPGHHTREPITIRLNDRLLTAEAGAYDSHALDIEETLAPAEAGGE